jgi:hypothetical protein
MKVARAAGQELVDRRMGKTIGIRILMYIPQRFAHPDPPIFRIILHWNQTLFQIIWYWKTLYGGTPRQVIHLAS